MGGVQLNPRDVMSIEATYEIDGRDFSTLEEFFDVIGHVLIPGATWGRNLDAFNDILRGGFGKSDRGFVLRSKNSAISRQGVGYPETVRQLQLRLARCHPPNRESVTVDLEAAKNGVDPTVFDWLLDIIRVHGQGGNEAEDGVTLELA